MVQAKAMRDSAGPQCTTTSCPGGTTARNLAEVKGGTSPPGNAARIKTVRSVGYRWEGS